MYAIYRGIVLSVATIMVGIGAVGTAVALEVDIGAEQMTEIIDLVQTFLISLGLLGILFCVVICVFVRWYMKNWGPGEIDPITATMFKPIVDRMERIEQKQEKILDNALKPLLEDYHKRKSEHESEDLLPL